jgi:tetratricopeptide (TPR) repeat protein
MKIVSRVVVFAAIFLLSLQYIGCGGAELSSAKLYRQQRNYLKANDLLEQALKSDPTSDEAWSLYVTNLYDLNRYENIAEVIDTARLYAVKNRVQVEYVRRNTWVGLYNGALNAYQQNPDSKEQQDAAVALLESARKVAPEQPETYELLGDVYYSAGDTAKYIATYEEALKQVRSIHDQGVALGLMLKQDPAGAESAIGGAPARKEMVALSSTDSVMIYVYPSKEAYLYFEKTKKTPRKWQLTGWKFTNSEPVGMQPTRVSLRPYQSIAQYYLDKGNASLAAKDTARAEESFEKAVSLLISVQRLDPSDESAASIIPNTYNRLGQREKMKSEYERMLARLLHLKKHLK